MDELTPEERTKRLIEKQLRLGKRLKKQGKSVANRPMERNSQYFVKSDVRATFERIRAEQQKKESATVTLINKQRKKA